MCLTAPQGNSESRAVEGERGEVVAAAVASSLLLVLVLVGLLVAVFVVWRVHSRREGGRWWFGPGKESTAND